MLHCIRMIALLQPAILEQKLENTRSLLGSVYSIISIGSQAHVQV